MTSQECTKSHLVETKTWMKVLAPEELSQGSTGNVIGGER